MLLERPREGIAKVKADGKYRGLNLVPPYRPKIATPCGETELPAGPKDRGDGCYETCVDSVRPSTNALDHHVVDAVCASIIRREQRSENVETRP